MAAKKTITRNGKYVAYYRVSTTEQGESGLGLAAQRRRVTGHMKQIRETSPEAELIASFQEVESGTRRRAPSLMV